MEHTEGHAGITGYLLSVEELQIREHEALWHRAYELLDEERRLGLDGGKQNAAWYERVAAGVLLQKALWEEQKKQESGHVLSDEPAGTSLQVVTLPALIEELEMCGELPFLLHYRYGEKGKPYLEGNPLYFNLSHSDGKVLCAVSCKEVGADIQCVRRVRTASMVERFFSQEEKQAWQKLSGEEQESYFYRAWTRKEAYAKLRGAGIGDVLHCNVMNEGKQSAPKHGESSGEMCIEEMRSGEMCTEAGSRVVWQENRWENAYIAICSYWQ